MTMPLCETFHIAASHPALPGHFPGRPIVPGVVLLDRIAAAAERGFGRRLVALPEVKFRRPLAPGATVRLRLERTTDGARFALHCGAEEIARGTLELAPP